MFYCILFFYLHLLFFCSYLSPFHFFYHFFFLAKAKLVELIDALTGLEIIIEERNKINHNKLLEIEETEEIIENILKEFKEDKEDELEIKLSFLASKNIFLKRADNIGKKKN